MVSLPCVLLGFVVLRVLADRPDDASWLGQEEKAALKTMLAAEVHDRPKTSVLGAIFDVRVAVLALVQFGFTLGSYGIGIWMPLILKEQGLGDLDIALLLFGPYTVAIVGMLGWAWLADRTGRKISNLALACLLGTVGFAVYNWSGSLALSLVNLTLALVGITAARAIFWSIPPRLLTGIAAAGGIAFINMIGTSGGLVGPAMMGIFRDATGDFGYGILAMAAVMAVTTVLALSLKLVVKQE
jgi:MFS family permease